MKTPLLTVAAASLLSACVSGFANREITPEQSGPFVTTNASYTPEEKPDQWWKLYQSPVLDGLIEQALKVNTDLRSAEANLRAVRAFLSESRTNAYLPSTTLSAAAQRGRPAANTVPGATTPLRTTETYSAGLDVSFEVDIFGRQRHSVSAAIADRDAAAAARDVVRVSVAAETARAYMDTCSANAQIAVASRTLDLQQRSYDLTQRLLEAGSGNGLDVARAAAVLESTRASVPFYSAQRDAALFRLTALIGKSPAQAPVEAKNCEAPLKLTSPIPVGDGAALLARRPDVRQAQKNLRGAAERTGIEAADLFPTIRLGGNAGVFGPTKESLEEPTALSFSIGPLLTWSFPNVFATAQRMAAANARADGALAQFDGVVLNALRETETALSDYANELDRNAALGRARDQSTEAARLAGLRFEAGRDSFLSQLDAQRTQAQSEAAYADSSAALVSKQITLFKALGGGWKQAPPVEGIREPKLPVPTSNRP